MSEKEEKEKKWFPRRWGKRKVSEYLSQLNKKGFGLQSML